MEVKSMFRVGDLVKINSYMKCDALQDNLGLKDLEGTFRILKIGDQIVAKNDTNGMESMNDKNYWITIKLSDGNSKKVSSLWLVAADDEEA